MKFKVDALAVSLIATMLVGCGGGGSGSSSSPIVQIPTTTPPPAPALPPVPSLVATQIKGIVIDRPFTVSDGKYTFDFSIDQLYFSRGILSVTPSYFPTDGSDQTKYIPEFAYRLSSDLSATAIPSVISTQHPRDVVVADFNGDGISDVYIADHGYDASPFPGGQSKLLLGSASGFVDATQSLPQQLQFTHSATAADIDSDGDIDIYVGNLNMNAPYFLINDGKAKFTKQDLFPASFQGKYYTDSLLVDLNGDKKFEIILGGDLRESEILSYDGVTFSPTQRLLLGDDSNRIVTSIRVADLDGNGSLDIILQSTANDPYYKGTRIDVFSKNNGSFTINKSYSGVIVSDDKWNKNLYISDINKDGKLDVISTGPSTKILLNTGSQFVIDKTALPIDQNASAVEMWDINGDGSLDFVYAQMIPNSLRNIQSVGIFTIFA